jgi:hypothetical protein
MIKKVLVLVFLVCSLMFVGSVSAADDGVDSYFNPDGDSDAIPTSTPSPGFFNLSVVQSINPKGVPISFPLYAPAEITLSYAEAQNYYVNFTSYDTSHSESQSPYGMSVSLFGVGTYMFSFNVYYSQLVNQSVTLTLSSGNSSFPMSIPISICNMGFVLDVVIVTSQEPYYPSAQDIWNYGNGQQQQLIDTVTQSFNEQQAQTNTFIIIGGVAVGVIAVVVVLLYRRSRQHDHIMDNMGNFGIKGHY